MAIRKKQKRLTSFREFHEPDSGNSRKLVEHFRKFRVFMGPDSLVNYTVTAPLAIAKNPPGVTFSGRFFLDKIFRKPWSVA